MSIKSGTVSFGAQSVQSGVSDVWRVQDLVQRARDHDETAFNALYERYSPRIERFLAHHLNGSTQEAEDLTADVFAKVVEKLDSYEFRGLPFSAWLFRVARNRLIDHARGRQRQGTQVQLDEAPEMATGESVGLLERGWAVEQIREALQLLTEEQRQVVVARFIRGLSLLETAAELNRTEEAIKKLQSRGLGALKRAMHCQSGCWRIG